MNKRYEKPFNNIRKEILPKFTYKFYVLRFSKVL